MTAPNKIKHNGQLYVLASPGPAQFGKCPWCKKKMEIGDELPEERICDACATLPQEKLEKLNPVLFRKLHKTASTPPKKQITSTPSQIKFRGAMYVKAGGGIFYHKRCPAGKHWNSKTKKCEKLPLGLKTKVSKALTHSKAAHSAQKVLDTKGKSAKSKHVNSALSGHFKAQNAALRASEHAEKHGFKNLAKNLMSTAVKHGQKAKKIYKYQ